MSLLPLYRLAWIIIIALLGSQPGLAATNSQAASCQGCHGVSGNSQTPEYPSLAGQKALYIESQLNAFKSGRRSNAVMQGLVANLSKKEITELAIYFSKLSPKSAGGSHATLVSKGKTKASMCMGCHGRNAQGQGGFPRLAGQQPKYLKKQLMDFKQGRRKGGPMNYITKSLSESDIEALAAYLGSLN